MSTKPKLQQKENPTEIDGRDLFQTPNYATELLIPFIPKGINSIWECAAGGQKISKVLLKKFLMVTSTDLQYDPVYNFLTYIPNFSFDCIITNPPFSIKRKFFDKCLMYGVPFALLIPADYSGWICDAITENGAEKIVPNRRVDFITPSGKESHAQFHSMWLTWGFNIGQSETIIELTNEMKKNI